jgi:hypothetical protein
MENLESQESGQSSIARMNLSLFRLKATGRMIQ